ncbi:MULTISPECIES: hypothetical protein [unclassified Mesorhizobium]|uniref:hypothetical protein n=1 Tax=unclassified Mesorhizobium TaxID=325217 RepID=UPI000FCA3D68|nr:MULTISPECIES: hypothetical protein [unclassified Mesorhizobium]TGU07853.1 hypothetical protein EN806_31405 [bacterium M00.F.Ca.ET.163.01.1.1]TGU47059.1 hypothetical protein EN789_13580 [bacterium M00.F.Ca.ET.146.01.1.1]TGW12713.1 hypothetical protein EN788_08125 [Mesorhizobium sp. M2D.F.Ca.ET.145.01.1.1]TGP33331.1 hypothetical protein EN875_015425 [Mesorhizobium sp. M2D.F.Ca.ET.232.01.1.1]TGP59371.1 hypothetical protein EN869_013915 [Mesorhizobium sp. M2D.F.Ca.ET.226.01.1.1]
MTEIEILRGRIEALEIEAYAHSAIISALREWVGTGFLDRAAEIAQATAERDVRPGRQARYPDAGSEAREWAVRIIDDFRTADATEATSGGIAA